jgi:hypothetical protein
MAEKESVEDIPESPPICDNERRCYHMVIDWAGLSEKSWETKHKHSIPLLPKKGKQSCFFFDSFYNAQAYIT